MSELAERIVAMLLELPADKRAQILAEVRYNDVFCPECGVGEPNNPNPDCQCRNDRMTPLLGHSRVECPLGSGLNTDESNN